MSPIQYLDREALPDDLQDFPKGLTLSPFVNTPYSNRAEINERLLSVRPDDFATREYLETDKEHTALTIRESETDRIKLVSEILHAPKLQELIKAGKITAALVKPHVHKGKSSAKDEIIAAKILKEEIKPPLRVLFALPVHMTPNDVRYFYDSVYAALSTKPDPETNGKTTVWERFEAYMTSGASTMVLLYSEDGNAVSEWRDQLGPTRPEKDEAGTTIRGKYGWDMRGNVGHGSNADKPEEKDGISPEEIEAKWKEDKVAAVQYEAGWMKDKVDSMLADHENQDKFMTEEDLRAQGILGEREVFLAIERFIPKQKAHSAGSSFSAYIVSLIGESGKQEHRRFIVKSFDNNEIGNPINKALAESETERIRLFKELVEKTTSSKNKGRLKVGTPRPYTVSEDNQGAPAILREYIPSSNETVLNMVDNPNFDPSVRCGIIDGLIYAAAMMDAKGIKSRNIVENFLYDGTKWVYIGSSNITIEDPADQEVTTGLADLLQRFGDDQQLSDKIRKRYLQHRKNLLGKRPQPQN